MNIVRGAWNEVDLSSFGFSTDRDFYISTIQDAPGSNCPGTGIDQSAPGDRSYMNLDGEFQLISSEGIEGALMIRAIVGKSVDSPVITNLGEINYTNQDVITVEGTVQADCKVNIYVNGEIAAFEDTVNNAFAIDVELTEEENIIMATAELNERQTEPSPEITVIKDQELPVLVVDAPIDGAKINKEAVHVIGNVTDNKGIGKLLINEEEAVVNEDGSFDHRLMVDEGELPITIKAVDFAGNIVMEERTVIIDLEAPVITNMMPDEDIVIFEGEVLNVSFNSEPDGEAYFRIAAEFAPAGTEVTGIPMIESEETPGLYEGNLVLPEGFAIRNGVIEFEFIDGAGNRVVEVAPGRVTVEAFALSNIEPADDVTIVGGETVEISFNAPIEGTATYRILLPFGAQNNVAGVQMVEETPGFYRAIWTAQDGMVASGLIVELTYVKGNRSITEYAPGTITVIGDMQSLPSNAVIVGDEAFDIRFLDNSEYAQGKLREWQDAGNPVYIKLNQNTVVNTEGEVVNMNVFNNHLTDYFVITYYDRYGNTSLYR